MRLAILALVAYLPVSGQKTYRTIQDYCRDFPDAATCTYTIRAAPPSAAAPSTGPAAPRTAQIDWRFAHPDPDALLCLNLRSIEKWPLWNGILTAILSRIQQPGGNIDTSVLQALYSDFDRLQISSKGADLLIVFSGGPLQVVQRIRPAAETHKAWILDDRNFLLGLAASSDAAAQRFTAPLKPSAALQQARELASYDVFAIVRKLDSPLAAALQPVIAPLQGASSLTYALSIRGAVRSLAIVSAPTPKAAQALEAGLRSAEPSLLLANQPAAKAKILRTAATLRISATAPLSEPLSHFASQFVHTYLSRPASVDPQLVSRVTPPRKTVVITGAESGTREISLEK